jgi:hypothetical protein
VLAERFYVTVIEVSTKITRTLETSCRALWTYTAMDSYSEAAEEIATCRKSLLADPYRRHHTGFEVIRIVTV